VDQVEAAVKADQAAIDNARVQLNYTTITAPIDGRTGIRQVDAGNIIRANDTNALVVLTQLKPISIISHCRNSLWEKSNDIKPRAA